MSSQYDDMIKKLEEVEKINKDVIQENERLKAELLRMANEVNQQKGTINNLEQYSRRNCLEIKGIPGTH
jgi:predicted nuclease with TOPRIM domain